MYFFEHIPIRDEETKHEGKGVQLQWQDVSKFYEGYRKWIANSSFGSFSTVLDWIALGRIYHSRDGWTLRII